MVRFIVSRLKQALLTAFQLAIRWATNFVWKAFDHGRQQQIRPIGDRRSDGL
jgi:hypothetical protein